MAFDTTNASERGRLGAVKRAKKRPLDLDRVEAELPPLNGPEDVKTRLDRLTSWAAAGLMSPGNASACVRACEGWLRAHDASVTQAQMREAERTIKALKAALADAQRASGLRRGDDVER